MKRSRISLLIGALLVGVNSDSFAQVDRERIRTVAGQVVEWDSRAPVEGATVTLLQRNYSLLGNLRRGGLDALPTLLGKAVTGKNGQFSFQTISRGPFEISISHRARRLDGVRRIEKADSQIEVFAYRLQHPLNLAPPKSKK